MLVNKRAIRAFAIYIPILRSHGGQQTQHQMIEACSGFYLLIFITKKKKKKKKIQPRLDQNNYQNNYLSFQRSQIYHKNQSTFELQF